MRDLIKKILREETSENLKEDKLKSLVFKLINNAVEGVDVYKNKGDLWLIFTDEERWVINFKESGDLYYNYYFFQNIFKYFSMDVVENQHYITEWVEDTIKNGVKYSFKNDMKRIYSVEDTIKNGVKYSFADLTNKKAGVEDTIKNGVRYTYPSNGGAIMDVEDTIQKGIKLNKN